MPISDNHWRNRFILSLFFLFPILNTTVRHGGSSIYILLILLGFIFYRKGASRLTPKEKPFLIGIAVFFLFSCFSLVITEDFSIGVRRLERYGRLLTLIPIYCMLRGEAIETGKAFLYGVATALLVMLSQGLYEVEILKSYFYEGAYYRIINGGMSLFFTTLILMILLIYEKKMIHYVVGLLWLSMGLYVSLLSGSRNAFLFIPYIIVSLLWLYRKRLTGKQWILTILGIGIGSLLLMISPPERLVWRLENLRNLFETFTWEKPHRTSLGIRVDLWRNSLLIFKDSPVFGTGMGDFMHDSKILFEKGLSFDNDIVLNTSNAHSIYFMLLAEGGLVGLVLLLFVFFVLPFRLLHRLWLHTSDKEVHLYALFGLITILAFAWFGLSESWVNRNPWVNAYCMTMLAFMTSAINKSEGRP